MYTINYDTNTIYDPRLSGYQVRDAKAELKVSDPGSLTFTIDADHPNAGQLKKLAGVVELAEDGDVIYRGRIIRETRGFDNEKEIETEGLLACLYDSAIPPFSFPSEVAFDPAYQAAAASGNVVDYFLGWILGKHNAQIGTNQYIRKGNVTVTDPGNHISRSTTDYASAWEILDQKLVGSSLGGYFLVRYESDGVYLDYLSTLTAANPQPVEFGENLLDFSEKTDGAEIFTQVLPVGKDGLDISSLPDGPIDADLAKLGTRIYSSSLATLYGPITRVLKFPDISSAALLQSAAAAKMTEAGGVRQISVSAIDLNLAGFQSFRLGRMTTVTSAPHGFSEAFPLVELDVDILDPAKTKITLGKTEKEQTGMTSSVQRTVVIAAAEASEAKQATDGLRTGETTVSGGCITTGRIQSGVNPDCYMDLDAGELCATIWQNGDFRIILSNELDPYSGTYKDGIVFQKKSGGSWKRMVRFWDQGVFDLFNGGASGTYTDIARFTAGAGTSSDPHICVWDSPTHMALSDTERVQSGFKDVSVTNTTHISFPQPFFSTSAVVTASFATVGDSAQAGGTLGTISIFNVTTSGFDVRIVGGSGAITRTIHWIAQAY